MVKIIFNPFQKNHQLKMLIFKVYNFKFLNFLSNYKTFDQIS
jgi:hypothetical protein